MDDTQVKLLESIADAKSSTAKGNLNEKLVNGLFEDKPGWVLLDGKYGGNNGFDQVAVFTNADGVKSVLVIDTKPLLQRGVALDRNAAGKTVQLSDNWFDKVGERLGKDNEAYKAIVEARDLGTLSKVIAVPDRTNKMVNLVKVNVPNKEELLLLKKK